MVATNIRREARESLAGKWGKGVLIVLAQAVILFIISLILRIVGDNNILSNIVSLILFLLEVPLSVGLMFSFIKLKRNEEVNPFEFIKLGFENFGRSWAIYLRILLKMILPIICIVAAIILYSVMLVGSTAGMLFGNASIGIGWIITGIAIYVAAIAYAVVIGLLYALAFNIAYDNPAMSAKDAVNESARLMKGHRGDFFVLNLSFIGWAILSCFTFGIGLLWLIPYMQVSLVCFYDEVLELDGNKLNKVEKKEDNGPIESV